MPRVSTLLSERERQKFALFLREARGEQSIRQVAVALAGENVDKADVNRRRITDYETGAVFPTVGTTCRLAEVYGIPTLRLLLRAGHVAELLRPIVTLLEVRKSTGLQVFRQAGAVFALFAFPRRGETPGQTALLREPDWDNVFSAITRLERPRGRLPRLIGLAEKVLRDSSIPSDARRNIAAEYVHTYVYEIEPLLYVLAFRQIYLEEKRE
jgi:transcriptional regulator with XRE-family HTH domain